MKTKIFSILLTVAAMAGFSACSDDWNPNAEGQGQLRTASLGVEVDGAETVVTDNSGSRTIKAKSPASRATIDLSNFIVSVATTNGTEVSRWTYSDMPELPTFATGDYTVTVKSHEVEPAAWNAPYYEGSQSFTIEANKVTEVQTVVCKLANIRVSVAFSDDLLNAFDNPDEVTVKITSEGNNSLTFTPSETRSGYFAALDDLETLRIDFSASILGSVETFTKTVDNVAKGQHRKISFGLTSNPNLPPDEIGTITNDGQGITVDSDVVEDEPIETDYPWYEDNTDSNDRPGGEEWDDTPENPDTPGTGGDESTTDAIRFESSNMNLDGVDNASDLEGGASVDIFADNGIANLKVKIDSDKLTPDVLEGVGLAAEFDLAYPGTYQEGLEGLGFPTGSNVIGQTQLTFDITQFMSLLQIYPGGTNKFILTVIDQQGNTKTVTLTILT